MGHITHDLALESAPSLNRIRRYHEWSETVGVIYDSITAVVEAESE